MGKQGVNLNSLRNVLVDIDVVELIKLHGKVFELVDVDLDVRRCKGVFDAEVEADVLVIDTHVIADALVPGKVLVDVDVVELVVLEGLLLRRCHSAPNLLAVSPPGGVHGEELLLRRR
eukprot:5001072-Amphidinium_carterae.1